MQILFNEIYVCFKKIKKNIFVLFSNNDNYKYDDNNNVCINNYIDFDNLEIDIIFFDNVKIVN